MRAEEVAVRTRFGLLSVPAPNAHRPPGWSVNPSLYSQRLPVILLAVLGLTLSIDMRELSGALARDVNTLAIEAALAIAVITGSIGSERRWSRKPWLVAIFGLAIGPAAFVASTWSLIELSFDGTWNSREVGRSVAALMAIGPAMDEVLASLQFVRSQSKKGRSPIRVFLGMSPKARRRQEIK